MKQMLVKQSSTLEAAELLRNNPTMPGAAHDVVNVLYNYCPEEVLLEGQYVGVPTDLEVEGLLAFVGTFLSSGDDRLLIAERSQYRQLFNTPHWRLWCSKYQDWRELEKDHEQVFGVGVDGRKPLEVLIEESKTAVKALFLPS